MSAADFGAAARQGLGARRDERRARAGSKRSGPGTSARPTTPGCEPEPALARAGREVRAIGATEARHEEYLTEDADHLVVSWGTSCAFVDYVVDELRADGQRVGSFRPITLWPFPEEALDEVTSGART